MEKSAICNVEIAVPKASVLMFYSKKELFVSITSKFVPTFLFIIPTLLLRTMVRRCNIFCCTKLDGANIPDSKASFLSYHVPPQCLTCKH